MLFVHQQDVYLYRINDSRVVSYIAVIHEKNVLPKQILNYNTTQSNIIYRSFTFNILIMPVWIL